ncbi:hypothetical protein ScPMuIL_010308 [Solemya velum]
MSAYQIPVYNKNTRRLFTSTTPTSKVMETNGHHLLLTVIGCSALLIFESVEAQTCGSYDRTLSMCCGGQVRRKVFSSSRCCGTQIYDSDVSMCCNGQVRGRPFSSSRCCGTHSYDSDVSMCCSGHVRGKPFSSSRCCGTQSYDSDISMCCGGQIRGKSGFNQWC